MVKGALSTIFVSCHESSVTAVSVLLSESLLKDPGALVRPGADLDAGLWGVAPEVVFHPARACVGLEVSGEPERLSQRPLRRHM